MSEDSGNVPWNDALGQDGNWENHSFYPLTLREVVWRDECSKAAFMKSGLASKRGALTGTVKGPWGWLQSSEIKKVFPPGMMEWICPAWNKIEKLR